MATDLSKSRYPHVPERNKRICARYDEGRASGLSLTDLGKEFGLSRETIRLIVRKHKRRRKHSPRLALLREAFARGVSRQSAERL